MSDKRLKAEKGQALLQNLNSQWLERVGMHGNKNVSLKRSTLPLGEQEVGFSLCPFCFYRCQELTLVFIKESHPGEAKLQSTLLKEFRGASDVVWDQRVCGEEGKRDEAEL